MALSGAQVMIIGDVVPSFLGFLNAPEALQDRTLVLVLSATEREEVTRAWSGSGTFPLQHALS